MAAGWWVALLGRLGDQIVDPASLLVLQERLLRHGAELQGQVPELLLRGPDAAAAVSSWLADKDLSHWVPQAAGGTTAQGWQFETASWNRSRGAELMDPVAISRAHLDGGLDALSADGVPQAIGLESLEAALVAGGISLALWLLRHRSEWAAADPEERTKLLEQGLACLGVGMMSGAAVAVVLSLALALVPGGQLWLTALSIGSLSRTLPSASADPFRLSSRPLTVPRGS